MSDSIGRLSPTVGRVRAYFAPVNRSGSALTGQPTVFHPAQISGFALDQPPAPWMDLGWIFEFTRTSGSKVESLRAGAPAVAQMQVRTEVEATVEFAFETWGKLQVALACGSQSMNVLAVESGASSVGSDAVTVAAVPLLPGSTASMLQVGVEAALGFASGQWVAVDLDYAGQTGFVPSGVAGAYLRSAVNDVNYLRRVSLNAARIANVAGGTLILDGALPMGAPSSSMKVSRILGFCDREGGTFFAEWSGLFVAEGQQGERVAWYYPRLQVARSAVEDPVSIGGGYENLRLRGAFRALPIVDDLDGEPVICFRSYLLA